MKFLALATTLALSTSVFAASNSSINDLQYLPDAGTVFGTTTFNYLKFSSRDFNGTATDHSTSSGSLVTQNIGYSVMNNFSVSADLVYSNSKSEVNGANESKTTGFGDVAINGKYRVIDAEKRLDIVAKLSVSPGDAEVDSDGDSNGYSGGHALGLGADYGTKKGPYQWSVTAFLNHSFEATTDDKEVDKKFKNDAHNALSLGANLLTQLSESCYIKNFAGIEFTEEYDDNNNGTTTGSTNYTLGSEFQHLVSKDLVVKAGVNTYIGGSGYNFVVLLYSLGASYQF